MKNVIVLGSTGTLGVAALKVLKKYRKYFRVFGLVAGENEGLLRTQAAEIAEWMKPATSTFANNFFPRGSVRAHTMTTLLASRDGRKKILELIRAPEVDVVMNLIPGLAGLPASEAAIKAGKTLLLANKESLVADGKRLMKMAKRGAQRSTNNLVHSSRLSSIAQYSISPHIIPLDSEHNAIFEILQSLPAESFSSPPAAIFDGQKGLHSNIPKVGNSESRNVNLHAGKDIAAEIEAIYLPCSGGPFLGYEKSQLKNVTVKDVLAHPVWKMGPKVTVESATLLNKGFEIIEAHHLFNLPLNKIKVFIHPEGQVHGIVKFRSAPGAGSKKATKKASPASSALSSPAASTIPTALAYRSRPSMSLHIENALRAAEGLPAIKGRIRPLSPAEFKFLTSQKPNHRTFPGIKIALAAFKKSQEAPSPTSKNTMKAFLKHEEKLITHFLQGRLQFAEILRQLSSR